MPIPKTAEASLTLLPYLVSEYLTMQLRTEKPNEGTELRAEPEGNAKTP